jgi:K+-transporting ATPase KdpF subunit
MLAAITLADAVGLAVALLLMAYLSYALFRGEKL